jgi:hypothetical protein
MLKSLDILIGLAVIMLVLSMAVTLINQALLTMLASRGRCLRTGLSDLLVLLDAGLDRTHADDIAARILSHPVIRCNIGFPGWLTRLMPGLQYGEVIHREEFVKILIIFGAHYTDVQAAFGQIRTALAQGEAPAEAIAKLRMALGNLNLSNEAGHLSDPATENRIQELLDKLGAESDPARQRKLLEEAGTLADRLYGTFGKLYEALKDNGIHDPGLVLDKVRMRALELEQSHPELANDIRQGKALLEEASSKFLAKVHLNFDPFMDRISSRFTYQARLVTFFSATLVTIALQLDTVDLVNRLAMDDKMRAAFVAQAMAMADDEGIKAVVDSAGPAKAEARPDSASTETPPASAETIEPAPGYGDRLKVAAKTEQYYLSFLAEQGVISLPEWGKWREHWKAVSLPGLLVSILLLSLGAPFWYGALSQLLQLRSAVARKDQDQRQIRQTTQAPGSVSGQGASGNAEGSG